MKMEKDNMREYNTVHYKKSPDVISVKVRKQQRLTRLIAADVPVQDLVSDRCKEVKTKYDTQLVSGVFLSS